MNIRILLVLIFVFVAGGIGKSYLGADGGPVKSTKQYLENGSNEINIKKGLVNQLKEKKRETKQSLKKSPEESLKKKLKLISDQAATVKERLENIGYPEVLNKEYLSISERNDIHSLSAQYQKLESLRLRLSLELINKETSI